MLLSILKQKCPRCRKGNLFLHSNAYNVKYLTKMPPSCKVCGQLTEPETGFYFGAMYVSYGLGVLMFAFLFVLMEFILKIKGYHFMWVYAVIMVLLWPLVFRYSRVIYIYTFVGYDKNAE
jgi:uncharacterized protein (DUF983 family)